MEKQIRKGVYKTLRKLGAQRDEISPDALLMKNIFFDHQEWICFLFLIESHFDITISKFDEEKIKTVESTIKLIQEKQYKTLNTRSSILF
ncbi:MAG: hypothetical protein JEZ09_14155 [Salinivirgaceae bacterium]|nr:hypothetical protein [Salinivirgaceae bacterium]